MKTPQEILDEYSVIAKQDMAEYVPFLREIARGRVLEIGVCQGVSTSAFLLGMDDKDDGYLFSIDIDPACGERLSHPRWTFIPGDSRQLKLQGNFEFDVLLIDGEHHYDTALSNLRKFSPLVKRGGTILMHDVLPSEYGRSVCPEIDECRKAWDEFRAEHPDWPTRIMPGLFGMGVITKQ